MSQDFVDERHALQLRNGKLSVQQLDRLLSQILIRARHVWFCLA